MYVTGITIGDHEAEIVLRHARPNCQSEVGPIVREIEMRGLSISKLTDILVQILAFGLATACLLFAGYMVIRLQNMENPPADMGLNFPPPKRKVITDEPVLVDPMPTGSIGSESARRSVGNRPSQPYSSEAPIQDYRLLTVIEDVAFVEILTLRGKSILPLVPGVWLPGAGPVERIEKIGGRWVIVAGDVKLVSERH
jgi:hypothetical protein